jgi:hypothetical protein
VIQNLISTVADTMRKAAREVGWSKLQTYGTATATIALAGVVDQRDVPEEYAAAVERHQFGQMQEAADAVSKRLTSGTPHAVRGSVFVAAQEFRAAYAADGDP